MAGAQLKRLVVVGNGNCGKTSMIQSFTTGCFKEAILPTVFDHQTIDMEVNDTQVFIELRDTSGYEDYAKLRSISYPNADVIIVCFAIDDPESLSSIMDRWYPEVRHYCPMCPIMLVGTKSDARNDSRTIQRLSNRKQKTLRPEEGRNMKDRIGAVMYLECSAKENKGIKDVFTHAVRLHGTNKSQTRKCCVL